MDILVNLIFVFNLENKNEMKKEVFIFILIFSHITLFAQEDSMRITKEKEYSFIIEDSPAKLFTMRQMNESSLSVYRIAIGEINKVIPTKLRRYIDAGLILSGLFYVPLTHEEGHRSILTYKNIGSISQPYFNKNLAAYVVGVRDADLNLLRDTDLPTYIRLHTAGLESDYAMLLREASLMTMKKEDVSVLWGDYLIRKFSLIGYYCYGLLKADAGITEEANELKRGYCRA